MSPQPLAVVIAVGRRTLTKTLRRPVALTFSLVQPLLWMTLFGFLFARFDVRSLRADLRYLDFLVPGVACMSALFGASQAGIELVRDLQTGFLERVLSTRAPRAAILLGKVGADALRLLAQAAMVVLLGALLGAHFTLHLRSLLVGTVAVFTLSFALACVSCALACIARAPEGMAAYVHIVNMPLLFTSTALVPARSMPPILSTLADANPLTMAADALRSGLVLGEGVDGIGVLVPLVLLATVCFVAALAALRRIARD